MDAAYIYLTEPQARVKSARMYPCDPVDVDGNCPSTCSSPRSDWIPKVHETADHRARDDRGAPYSRLEKAHWLCP
ncbi:hypothetical protein OHA31_01265 [Streptomyces sp. NBC_00649]|nr:hypothetical protein [Streptomyces sp. NBC_00063]